MKIIKELAIAFVMIAAVILVLAGVIPGDAGEFPIDTRAVDLLNRPCPLGNYSITSADVGPTLDNVSQLPVTVWYGRSPDEDAH